MLRQLNWHQTDHPKIKIFSAFLKRHKAIISCLFSLHHKIQTRRKHIHRIRWQKHCMWLMTVDTILRIFSKLKMTKSSTDYQNRTIALAFSWKWMKVLGQLANWPRSRFAVQILSDQSKLIWRLFQIEYNFVCFVKTFFIIF